MIPSDLHVEILLSLPVKSLLRFSCASKSWLKTITDPSFVASYNRQIPKTDPELLVEINSEKLHPTIGLNCAILRFNEHLVEQEVIAPPVHSVSRYPVKIAASCNGLLCLSGFRGCQIYLLNPAIKRLKELPISPDLPDPDIGMDSNLKYIDSLYNLGIGFDSSTGDLKIVKIRNKRMLGIGLPDVQIYSLRSNSWKTLSNCSFIDSYSIWDCTSSAAIDNAYFWIAIKTNTLILSFDFNSETFREIKLPKSDFSREVLSMMHFCLENQKGNLHLIVEILGLEFCIFTMVDDSWVKTYSVQTRTIFNPSCFWTNNRVICTDACSLSVYNLDENTLTNLGIYEIRNVFAYSPSLALLGDEESRSFKETRSSELFDRLWYGPYGYDFSVLKEEDDAPSMKRSGQVWNVGVSFIFRFLKRYLLRFAVDAYVYLDAFVQRLIKLIRLS